MKVLILAGGSGTRLWPLSRSNEPKQFIRLLNSEYSLFQQTFLRSLKLTNVSDVFIVTNAIYKKFVNCQLSEIGINIKESNILCEPVAKNTLPAITYGVTTACKNCEDTVIVFPSDNKIEDEDNFISIIKASKELSKNNIVTFGIKPTSPNTGYGYIAPGNPALNGFHIKEFKEKPTSIIAKQYIQSGYLWNSGIFMFNSEIFMQELLIYAPEIYSAFKCKTSAKESYKSIKNGISIDYGLMEFTKKSAVVPSPIIWNDLGSFDSFDEVFKKDNQKNIAYNKEIMIEAKNNLVISEDNEKVVMVGVDNLIVVSHKDGLLICKKKQTGKIKDVVNVLKQADPSLL